MKTEELLKWFNEELLPVIVKSGAFAERNESQTVEKCHFEDIERGVSSWASAPCFAKLVLRTASGTVTRDLLVKFQCQSPVFREKMMTVPMYENEVALYTKIFPAFRDFLKNSSGDPELIDKIAPKCYFASTGNGHVEKAIVILEDLRSLGYKLSPSVVDLDLKHCLTTIERLAEFHSLSYAMKFSGWKPFEELKNLFEEIGHADTKLSREFANEYEELNAQRGIEYLLNEKDSEVPREYLENFRKILHPTFDRMRSVKVPTEPFSVICHGDCNRNNVLYKYANGEVTDAKLIDFQRSVYASPSLDLSFLIYMNTTLEFREKYFDELFTFYYSTVIKTTARILNVPEEDVSGRIPFRGFAEDFGRVAIHAYVIVSFFLPFMMSPDRNFEEVMETKTNREMAEENYVRGGEAASRRISEIIVDFYRRGFYR